MDRLVGDNGDCSYRRITLCLLKSNSTIVNEWKHFARELEIPEYRISEIARDKNLGQDTQEVLNEILAEWRKRKGSGATLNKLIEHMKQLGWQAGIDALKETFETDPQKGRPRIQKYVRLPEPVQCFIDSEKQQSLTLYTLDCKITIEKIQENTLTKLFNIKEFLEFVSTKQTHSQFKLLLVVNCEVDIKRAERRLRNFKECKFILVAKKESPHDVTPMQHAYNSISEDIITWDDLSPNFQDQIEADLCKLYNFSDLVSEMTSKLHGQILVELINGNAPNPFPNSIPDKIKYYIPRRIITRSRLSDNIFHEGYQDMFMFTGINKNELSKYLPNNAWCDETTNQIYRKDVSCRFLVQGNVDHFKKICESTDRPVHLISHEQDQFTLLQSKGKMDSIHDAIHEQQVHLTEFQMQKLIMKEAAAPFQPVCISDTAGMGKTVLLASIGRQIQKQFPEKVVTYTTFCDLVNRCKIANLQTFNLQANSAILKRILISCSTDNPLGEAILKSKWDCSTPVKTPVLELLLDGFDELSPDYIDLAKACLGALLDFRCVRVWVTTRPYYLSELENHLNILGYEIKPFEEHDQVNFLVRYWGTNMNKDGGGNERLLKFARSCLDTLKLSMNTKENDIAGIPLQCLLIAEVYEVEARNYLKHYLDSPDSPNIPSYSFIQFYEKLVEKKFKIASKRHGSSEVNEIQLLEQHVYLSLQLIFPDKWQTLGVKPLNLPAEQIYNVGITEPAGVPPTQTFIHRTFAEYFVAVFIAEKIRDNHIPFKFLSNILRFSLSNYRVRGQINGRSKYFSSAFKFPVVVHFLNSLLIPNNVLSIPMRIENVATFRGEENKRKLAQSCFYQDLDMLFNLLITSGIFDNAKCRVFDHETVEVCIRKSGIGLLAKLMKVLEGETDSLTMDALVHGLHVAAKLGDRQKFKHILSAREDIARAISNNEKNSSTLLHSCVTGSYQIDAMVLEGKMEIMKHLININTRLAMCKDGGNIPLLCDSICPTLIPELVRATKDIEATDKDGKTFLHKASSYLSSVEFRSILGSLEKNSKNDKNLKRQLHNVVQSKSKIEYFEGTPLHSLLYYQEPEPGTLELFSRLGANFSESTVLEVAIRENRGSRCFERINHLSGNMLDRGEWRGNYLLHTAAKSGNVFAARFLCERGWNVNKCDNHGNLPLDLVTSASPGWYHVLLLLINRNAKFKNKGRHVTTLLFRCVEEGLWVIAGKLVSLGANLNLACHIRRNKTGFGGRSGYIFECIFVNGRESSKPFLKFILGQKHLRKQTLKTSLERALSRTNGCYISLRLFKYLDSHQFIKSADVNDYLIRLVQGKHLWEDSLFESIYAILTKKGANVKKCLSFSNGYHETMFHQYIQFCKRSGVDIQSWPDALNFFVDNGYDLFENGGRSYIKRILENTGGDQVIYDYLLNYHVKSDMGKLEILNKFSVGESRKIFLRATSIFYDELDQIPDDVKKFLDTVISVGFRECVTSNI